MKKRLALAFGLGLCASAYAGLKLGYNVTIANYGSYQVGYGNLGKARNSADTMQWISCDVSSNPMTTAVNCNARNTAGTFLTCYNRMNVEMRNIVAGIGESSYVRFQTDPADNALCHSIYVVNSSAYEPKQP